MTRNAGNKRGNLDKNRSKGADSPHRNDTGSTNPAAGTRTEVGPPGKASIDKTGEGDSSGM